MPITVDFNLLSFRENFMRGINCFFVIDRTKGSTNKGSSRWVKKMVSFDEEAYQRIFEQLKSERVSPQRIYVSVNPRNLRNAIYEFKQRQLKADYHRESARHYRDDQEIACFYPYIFDNWVSSLMKPFSRARSNFLIDLDSHDIDGLRNYMDALKNKNLQRMENYAEIYSYPTQNGYHLISKPFDVTLFDFPNAEIKKDGLILLLY